MCAGGRAGAAYFAHWSKRERETERERERHFSEMLLDCSGLVRWREITMSVKRAVSR